jgi:hypothetical protein
MSTDVREMTAGEAVEALRGLLSETRDKIEEIDAQITTLATSRRYWQGRKDATVDAISAIERGI